MYTSDASKALSTEDFMKILSHSKEAYEANSWGVLARLRFFKPYDLEVISFMRTKIIPNLSFSEINVLLNFYASSRKELGERFNHTELFEDMVSRVKDTIKEQMEKAKD
jgi:hypothetical protein